MNLAAVGADIERLIKTASMVTDSSALVHEINKEVRTISHLLHPPLLDEAGLASALRWYIEGFAERSKIKVDLEFPEDFGRLSRELETAIFRTVQECLTNIHRHAESSIAKIRITRTASDVRVEVADGGKGISPEKQEEMATIGTPGVGIRGMRERLRPRFAVRPSTCESIREACRRSGGRSGRSRGRAPASSRPNRGATPRLPRSQRAHLET